MVALTCAPQLFAGRTWHKSIGAAQKIAQEKNQLILVDMFAEWCGWCHRFEREVFPSEVFQNATKDIVLLRLDTEDGGEGTKISRQFGITSLPTFLVLTSDLSIAGIIRGYAPANDFVKSLAETRTKYADFEKRTKNEAAIAKDPVKRLALAKEYVSRNAYDKGTVRLKALMKEKGIPAAIRDEAYYQLALTYTAQNKLNEALQLVRELTALSKIGQSVEDARILAGKIYLQQGNLMSAATEFRNFKKAFPNSQHLPLVNQVLPELERRLAAASVK